MLLPLLLSAFAAAADFRLVGPPMSKQHAQQACAQENMTLAHVTRQNLAACAAAASKTTQPALWIAHGDRHVVLFNGAAAKASSDPNERCYALCATANAEHATEPAVLQKADAKAKEAKEARKPKESKEAKETKKPKETRKPKSAQTVALKEVRKAHHTHDPKQAGKKCRKGCYEHSFSTSDSWTSTHVSHEIKTRVPCRSHKHIYKKDCSVSSCSTSSESPCTESSSWTTEEVVRPHKRKHYRKQVSVKDKVKPQEVHHEVVRKQPKCDKKPHDKKDKRKERKMRCHGGQCRLTRSEPSASYSGYSDERRDGQYRLHKRAYSSDDEGTDSEDTETPTATTTTSDVKQQAKQMREVMHAAKDNGKQGAHERYRAPIQFPSSTTKKPAKPDTKSSSKSCSTPSSSESCSASSSSESCSASSSCSQPRRKLVYKVKKGKSGCRPYVEIPNKRYRPSPSSSSSSSCTSSSSSSEACKKGHASRHRHHSSTCSRSTESCHKHKHRCHHKCKKGGHKESPKTEPTKGKPKKAEEKPAKQAEKKPAKKADSKTGQKTGSKNEEKPKAAKSEQKSKTAKSEQKASAAKGKKPAADAPKKKEQQQKQKAKPTKQARRKHSSTESSSSSSSYEEKVAKKISVNPVSTSGSSSRKPVVLKKKHVKCRA